MKNDSVLHHLLAGACALTLCYAAPSHAGDDDKDGWYLGLNLGQSSNKIDHDRIGTGLEAGGITTGGGLATSSTDDSNSSTGGKLWLGYQFNNYFALEGGYFNLGSLGFTTNTSPPGTLTGTLKNSGADLDLVGLYPFSASWSGFARAGVTENRADADFSASGAVKLLRSGYSDTSTDYQYGLGAEYALSDSMRLRFEAERYHLNDSVYRQENLNLISVGLVLRFGAASKPATVVRTPVDLPAPPVVASEPTPAAAPIVPVAPPTAPEHVNFSADSFFEFDKADLKPEGELALQKFAHDLDGLHVDRIQVTGHTDRLGPQAHNQDLSLRRADSVKRYLVGQHLDQNRIATAGVGSAEPVTQPGQCQGSKPTPQLIACLSPDRRVQIDVSGTK